MMHRTAASRVTGARSLRCHLRATNVSPSASLPSTSSRLSSSRSRFFGGRLNAKATDSIDETETKEVALKSKEEELIPLDTPLKDVSSSLSGPEHWRELALCVGGAFLFGTGVWIFRGQDAGQEFFAGYLLEQSLSIDNLFVFILVFSYFQTPPVLQKRVLSVGIYSAAVLRLVMILAGALAIEKFHPVLLIFAGILLYSSYQLLTGTEEEEEDLGSNPVVQYCRKVLTVSDSYDGGKFFTTLADGTRAATPLLLVLAVIEVSDIVFAVDSIPAVFGVTTDPFIVYTSNIAAILSLRSLFAFVADVMTQLHYLEKSVALVLGFIGVKLVIEFFGGDVDTGLSLEVVCLLLGGGVAASLLFPKQEESDKGREQGKADGAK